MCILVNIGLGNGMLPDGNKPLPEPMLTFIYDATQLSPAVPFTNMDYL